MAIEQPFHAGELSVQKRVGDDFVASRNGRMISDTILPGAVSFIEEQALVVFGSVDINDGVWASVVLGTPGFMRSKDRRSVDFDITRIYKNPHDPLWTNITTHDKLGTLVIELQTRRRLRINGRLVERSADQLKLQVVESYPNCPKYIHRRTPTVIDAPNQRSTPRRHEGQILDSETRAIIGAADTFFVASAHPERGVDASHRGGPPGFVTIVDDRTLRIPDYVGNKMYNTLGNFESNPRAGLVFVDFASGQTLQLTGKSTIRWDLREAERPPGDAERFWDFRVERWFTLQPATPVRWSGSVELPR